MSELQTIEHGPEVLVPLNEVEAKKLDDAITTIVEGIGDRLATLERNLRDAERGQIHLALGFSSWTAYLENRLRGRWVLKGEERRKAAQLLASHGASTRAIGNMVGASKSQVARDIAEGSVPNGTVELDAEAEHSDDSPVDASVPNGTVLPDMVINTRTGNKQRRRKPKPKGDKPARRPSARKVVDRIAPRLEAFATLVAELDPTDVNAKELQKELVVIADAIGTVGKFLDGVKPARPQPALTVFRAKVKELAPIIVGLDGLTTDPRWSKTRGRFTDKDRAALDTHIEALQELRSAMDEAPATASGDGDGIAEAQR
jgi:hypothetical protein